MAEPSPRFRWAVVGLFVLAAAVLGVLAGRGVSPFKLQFTSEPVRFWELFSSHDGRHLLKESKSALSTDYWFIATYAGALLACIWLVGRKRYLSQTAPSLAASIAVVAAVFFDIRENFALRRALDAVDTKLPKLGFPTASTLYNVNVAATSKWVLLIAVGLFLWVRALQTPRCRPARTEGGFRSQLPGVPPVSTSRDFAHAPKGIACSGGGIRSASFSLGALQYLAERGVLAKASHVTAVSGGGYMAAGWAIAASANADSSDTTDDDVAATFMAGSIEERWLRRHSSLIPDIRTALSAAGRLVTGIALNVFLIWLVLFMVARPAGWAIHRIHPELRGRQPYIVIKKQPEVAPSRSDAEGVARIKFGDGPKPDTWLVMPRLEHAAVTYWTDANSDRVERTHVVLSVAPGLVGLDGNKLIVVRQPHVTFDAGSPNNEIPPVIGPSADPKVPSVVVSRQMTMEVIDSSAPQHNPLRSQFRVTAPRLLQNSGTTGRTKLKIDGGMWVWAAASVAFALAMQLVQMATRPTTTTSQQVMRVFTWGSAGVAAVIVALTTVLPWLIYSVPPFIADIVTSLPGPTPGPATASGATLTVAAGGTGLVTLLSLVRALRGSVSTLATKKPLLVGKVVVFVVLVLVVFVVFIGQVQLGAANGPAGHLVAAGTIGVGPVTLLSRIPDIFRWVIAALVLLGWRYAIDAHANSLFPFYKHRMSEAFAVERTAAAVKEVPYEVEVSWEKYGHFHQTKKDKGPELVLCATVNAYGTGEVASGRRSSSFAFSPEYLGGPDVGYIKTQRYHDAMSRGRQKDITIPAAIAIAGAAFSPGMGKMSLGPIDNLMAIANARLGVWLPHPLYVDELAKDPCSRWQDRPGWPQFLREVLGLFRLDTPYIYVTDGGHWENLGMVELLRRGCRNVFVLSAAGDGADSFSTIGEAIALAREELGVKICIDLEPMRAPWTEDAVEGGLRRGKDGKPVPFASKGYAIGEIFDRNPDGTYPTYATGYVVVIEANMTTSRPAQTCKEDWDVVTWAEGHDIFPDDSTLNQNFNHRLFESYRMRGRTQAEEACMAIVNAGLRTNFGL